ncbi:FadR family transcriptional regulator [Bacillus sp. FJAT-49711]|uniref:FadR/GntR family transcriptional regulator n=1 Tax=Bacillus sp. FJAT-49711 TaxID=2833585 RepID=UPI001BC96018|nr:FadR/GntR family transcriptional regulator [Bacillus sp. FJAT-49711]MBS4217468.1 FadR family transcriptional regulator [Bacillus sp. FJAT-49711]
MKQIRKVLLHELVAEEIRQHIKLKELKNGEKLPSAGNLAKTYGVSIASVREALRFLEAIGEIEVKNGKGIFVKEIEPFKILTNIEVEHEKKFLLEMCEVRRALEGMAVELAVERATPEQIHKMEAYLIEYDRLRELGEDKSNADLGFHKTIYEAAHNPILEKVIYSMSDAFIKFWEKPFGIETIFDDTYPIHVLLLDAIKNNDKKEARRHFDSLMDSVENTIRNVFIEGEIQP